MLLARSTELLSEAQEKPHFRCSARRANIVSFQLNFFFLRDGLRLKCGPIRSLDITAWNEKKLSASDNRRFTQSCVCAL